ncbi:FecCD family ABC transporter permease [Lusitaniella coriacea]|nr:iron ABC transporter permease [Lusitaniella coriacea]
MTRQSVQTSRGDGTRSRPSLWMGLGIGAIALLLCLVASTIYGATDISLREVYEALTAFDGSTEHLIIQTIRLPRSFIALLVGSALAVAGALMQGLTRNPLASPGILGINAGAAFAIVTATFLFSDRALSFYVWFAFLGAGLTAISVYLLGSLGRGGLTPLNLTIAGAAFTAFLASLTQGILIVNQRTFDDIRFWLAGSLAGRDLTLLLQVLPYLCVGFLLAFALGKPLATLSLGEDVAKGLGQSVVWVKGLAALSIVLLAGSSVAIAGPIGFIGLIVPHIVRFGVGSDYRWILPYAAIAGGILLLLADLGSRLVLRPSELPVGFITPLLGAPFFIYLARSRIR